MTDRRILPALPALLLLAVGCGGGPSDGPTSQRDFGTGLNTLERKYAKPAGLVFDAAVAALKHFDLDVEQDRGDALGGEVIARRASGDRATIKVRLIDAHTSAAAVRVEPGNRHMAELIHQRIAAELGLDAARSGWFGGGNVESATFGAPLAAAADAAEQACRALNLQVTARDVQPTTGRIEARSQTSIPVRIELARRDDARTDADIVAGASKTAEGKALVERIKADMAARLGPRRN